MEERVIQLSISPKTIPTPVKTPEHNLEEEKPYSQGNQRVQIPCDKMVSKKSHPRPIKLYNFTNKSTTFCYREPLIAFYNGLETINDPGAKYGNLEIRRLLNILNKLVSRLSAFLSSSSHNSVTFCSILKNKVSKSNLRLPLPN